MRRRLRSFLLILAGVTMVGYPWISNYLYEHRTEAQVLAYQNAWDAQDEEEREMMRREAEAYNESLAHMQVRAENPLLRIETDTDFSYEEILPDVMCILEIPKIRLSLPVYHGTSDEVLQKGVGHVEGSALPIGGTGFHSVLSGHTGQNNARLFTDLTDLEEGDLFFLRVLGETLAYQVCRIAVVLPEDTKLLAADTEKDLVTLLTCTPYGINSHRLLVTGSRVDCTEELVEQAMQESGTSDSLWKTSYCKALGVGAGSVCVLFLLKQLLRCLIRRRAVGSVYR